MALGKYGLTDSMCFRPKLKIFFPLLTCNPILCSESKLEWDVLNYTRAAGIRTCEITLPVWNTFQIFVLVVLPLEDSDK